MHKDIYKVTLNSSFDCWVYLFGNLRTSSYLHVCRQAVSNECVTEQPWVLVNAEG